MFGQKNCAPPVTFCVRLKVEVSRFRTVIVAVFQEDSVSILAPYNMSTVQQVLVIVYLDRSMRNIVRHSVEPQQGYKVLFKCTLYAIYQHASYIFSTRESWTAGRSVR